MADAPHWSRRKFLTSAGAAVPAYLAITTIDRLSAAGHDNGGGIVGVVRRSSAAELVIDADGHELVVRAAPNAMISRGTTGPLRDLAVFQPGDHVAVDGSVSGAVIDAVFIGSVFTGVSATVVDVSADRSAIETDKGRFDIRNLRPGHGRVGRDELAAGDHLVGLQWAPPSGPTEVVLATRH